MKLIAQYKRTFLLLALATAVMTGSCGGESYWSELKGGSSSGSLPPSFPVGIYVSTTGSDTTGDGSPGSPYQTIQNGITQAAANGLHAVFVAAGVYSEQITIQEGIALFGGYRQGYWTDRAITPAARAEGSPYHTRIESGDTTVSGATPITSATVIEGFFIRGKSAVRNDAQSNPRIANNTIVGNGPSGSSVGIYNSNSSPTIQFNIISGGEDASMDSYGIWNVTGASPVIVGNDIYGSTDTSINSSTGIYNSNPGTNPIIAGNVINGGPSDMTSYAIFCIDNSSPGIGYNTIAGGAAKDSYGVRSEDNSFSLVGNDIRAGYGTVISIGIYAINSPIKIINNTIRGGGGTDTDYSYGIDLASNSDAHIFNNTIDGGTADTGSYGIRIFNAAPLIRNNIIFISGTAPERIGITEGNPAGSSPFILTNNNIFSCDSLYRNDDPAMDIVDYNYLNIPGYTVIAGNLTEHNISVSVTLSADFRILYPPLSIRQGGADLAGFFDDDKDKNPRTVPWSIGAYEYD